MTLVRGWWALAVKEPRSVGLPGAGDLVVLPEHRVIEGARKAHPQIRVHPVMTGAPVEVTTRMNFQFSVVGAGA